MTEVVLRTASATDCRCLSALDVAIWRASYGDILSPRLLDRLARNPLHAPAFFAAICDRIGVEEWLWMIELGGDAVGYCHFGAARDRADGYAGEVARLYLLPEVQGRGIGTRVLAAAVRRLIDQGLAPVCTTVFENNRRARELYERLGARYLRRQIVFEDEGRPVWECVYGWPDPAPLLAAAANRAGRGAAKPGSAD